MPNTALVRHYATRTGFNLNFEQQVGTDIGMFGRFIIDEVNPRRLTQRRRRGPNDAA
jgi:hypothetical protein